MITRQQIQLPANKQILLEVMDARTIVLTTDHSLTLPHPEHSKKPTKLQVANEILIDLDTEFHKFIFPISNNRKLVYEIRHIEKVDNGKYLLSTHPRTICSYFLPPMLDHDREWFGWGTYFMNAYFVQLPPDKRPNGDKYCIGLLFRFIPTDNYRIFEHTMRKHEMYIGTYEMDTQTTLMLFRVPKAHSDDMLTVLGSKYSKLTTSLKNKVLKFHGFSKDGDMARILNKDQRKREQLELELGGRLSEDMELLEHVNTSTEIIIINDYGN